MGALRLVPREDEGQRGHGQDEDKDPLRDLLHDDAVVVDEEDLLVDIDAPLRLLVDPV